jgi:hypothetical protein
VSEEFALQQLRRDGAAVERNEELVAARGELVDRPGDQILAGPGFAGDENGAARRRDLANQIVDALHGGRAALDLFDPGRLLGDLAEITILPLVPRQLERSPDQAFENVDVEGLAQVVDGSELHCLDGGLDRSVGRQHDHGHAFVELAQLAHELDSVDPRHLQIREHQRGGFRPKRGECLLRIFECPRFEPQPLDQDLQDPPGAAVVVDDDHPFHESSPSQGRSMRKHAPRPGSESTWMRP